jgi:hypothetical protein
MEHHTGTPTPPLSPPPCPFKMTGRHTHAPLFLLFSFPRTPRAPPRPSPAQPLHQIKPPSPPPCCPHATEPRRPCRWPLEFPRHLGTPSCCHLRPSLTSSRRSGKPCSASPCPACSPSFRGAHAITASTPRPSASPGY